MSGEGSQVRKIAYHKAHEDYQIKEFIQSDIAIVTLEDPLDFSDPKVQPIESWNGPVKPNTYCLAIGCTQTRASKFDYASQIVDSQVLSIDTCQQEFSLYGILIQPGMFCAKKPCAYIRSNVRCNGDSGSPIVCPDTSGTLKMAGLVSWGLADCSRNSITVFTDISHYQDWIANNTEKENSVEPRSASTSSNIIFPSRK